MQTLITTLIIVLIVQTVVFIYANFFDIHKNKQQAQAIDIMQTGLNQHIKNEERLNDIIAQRTEELIDQNKRYADIAKMLNMTVRHLPNVVQKEAMRKLIEEGTENNEDALRILKEYYDWVKLLKYDDTGEDIKV